jgi:hypothetical protein
MVGISEKCSCGWYATREALSTSPEGKEK